jgi:hypothetical protein
VLGSHSALNISSRHAPAQSIVLPPMQLTSLKSTTADPVRDRLEKNGFTSTPTSRPFTGQQPRSSSVGVIDLIAVRLFVSSSARCDLERS